MDGPTKLYATVPVSREAVRDADEWRQMLNEARRLAAIGPHHRPDRSDYEWVTRGRRALTGLNGRPGQLRRPVAERYARPSRLTRDASV